MISTTKFLLFFSTFLVTLLRVNNVHFGGHPGILRPPIILPIYYLVQPPINSPKSNETLPFPSNFEEKLRKNRPLEPESRPPSHGDPATIEDVDDNLEDLTRYIWPFSMSMVPLTWTKKKKIHRHHFVGRHALDYEMTYHDYVQQMHNTAKGLDLDGIELQDVHAYKNGYGEGWNGDEYWLTDDEILHSKGYKKYRKHLKKSAKHLKKKLKFARWIQKFLQKKITKLDVIAPY